MSEKIQTGDPTLDYLLGGLFAAFSKTLVAPLERGKLLYQTQSANPKIASEMRYTGVINSLTRIPKTEGFLALWRGNFPNLIRYFPTEALNFLLKDTYKKIFCPFNPNTDFGKFFIGNLASGAAGGATAFMFVYPLDFARTRLAVDVGRSTVDRQFKGFTDCLTQIYKTDGVKGLYRGFTPAMAQVVICRAISFGGYDTLTGAVPNMSVLEKFLVAQCVTHSSTLLTYPLDTVRRVLMMQSGRTDVMYTGMMDCFKKIYQQEGIRGFYKGALFKAGSNIAGSGILVLIDELKRGNKH